MYTGKCGVAYTCDKYLTECNHCPALQGYPKSIFMDKTRQMFNAKKKLFDGWNCSIVTPSEWLEQRTKQSFLKDKDITTIWNGVDTSVFYPRYNNDVLNDLSIPQENKVVLFVGSRDKTKGTKWLSLLAHELLDVPITFLIVGGGYYEGTIEANMIFIDRVSDKDTMAMYYSSSDAFLICSKKETFSLTCAEALCCGTPVVGFECGSPELVFKGDSTDFVPYGDIDKLKEVLLSRLGFQ